LPVPAVNDATVLPESGAVVYVRPPPGFEIVRAFG
jgi:hypothetical protein